MRLQRLAGLVLALAVLIGQASGAFAGPTLVFEAMTGRIIAGEGENEPWHPASLTKLMTAYVAFHAIKSGRIALDSEITYSSQAAAQPPSKIGMRPGSTIKLDLALEALLVRSANDLAVAIAENVSGSVPKFVHVMNETARRLGMGGTYYANPHGLPDIRQVTTAHDLGILTSAIIREFPDYQHYFKEPFVQIGSQRYSNRNGLLRQMKSADGMKTGYVCSSGYNLIASATRDGRRLVAVVLGAKSGGGRTVIAESLLEKGFAAPVSDKTLYQMNPSVLSATGTTTDLTPLVCSWKPSVEVLDPDQLSSWAVAFGRFDSAAEAGKMLDQWLLATRYVFYGGHGAVVRVPYKGDYLIMVDDLNEAQSSSLCNYLRSNGAICQLMPPATLTVLAQESREEAAQKRISGAKVEAAGSGPPKGVSDSDE